jgi:hypothetical protein
MSPLTAVLTLWHHKHLSGQDVEDNVLCCAILLSNTSTHGACSNNSKGAAIKVSKPRSERCTVKAARKELLLTVQDRVQLRCSLMNVGCQYPAWLDGSQELCSPGVWQGREEGFAEFVHLQL